MPALFSLIRSVWLVLCVLVIISGAGRLFSPSPAFGQIGTGTLAIVKEPLLLIDDSDRASLLTASRHHLQYLRQLPPTKKLQIGPHQFSNRFLADSLQHFIRLVEQLINPADLAKQLAEQFTVYQMQNSFQKEQQHPLLTGYYEPLFTASLQPSQDYHFPIYRLPETIANSASLPATALENSNQRTAAGRLRLPSRAVLESSDLLAGNELAYLHDPLDCFFLHIQGSGKLRLPDNSLRAVRFAGSNDHPYTSIGKVLINRGALPPGGATMPAIRAYLNSHQESQQEILHQNARFIFFSWNDSSETTGSLRIPLTPGRSIAIDHQALPSAVPVFLRSRRPQVQADGSVTSWTSLQRFVLAQDSGAAIQGPNRIDLFCGGGLEAEITAGLLQEKASLYFLVKKRHISNRKE